MLTYLKMAIHAAERASIDARHPLVSSLVVPSALNNLREIVGGIQHEGTRAIRWTPRKGMQTLDVMGEVPFSNAMSINQRGTISTPEDRHSYVLIPKFPGEATPCPAPPTVASN